MTPIRIPLDVIDVEKPCPASWDTMRGDDRVRFCGECSLHVYNLSALTRPSGNSPTVTAPTTVTPEPAVDLIVGAMRAPVMGDVVCPPATQPAPRAILGKLKAPVQGELPATQPTTQPASK